MSYIEDVLTKIASTSRPVGVEIADRIRKLNAHGYLEGAELRGYHPHHTFSRDYHYDGIGPRKFIEMFGQSAYRRAPASALIRRGHRKIVRFAYILDIAQ